jgi:hypothetical protein
VADQWAQGVALQVMSLLGADGRVVLAEDYGRAFGYSRAQARHILNRAVEYGTVEKVRLADEGIGGLGARFGFRVAAKEGLGG